MSFWITAKALLWRNSIYRKRKPFSSMLEFVLPLLGVLLLLLVKDLSEDSDTFAPKDIPAIVFPDESVVRPLTFSDWLVQLQIERVCVEFPNENQIPEFLVDTTGYFPANSRDIEDNDYYITGNEFGNANPLMRCDPSRCDKKDSNYPDALPFCEVRRIGLVYPPDEFSVYLDGRYGSALDFDEVFQVFEDESSLEDYVTGNSYEDETKIAIAVVFDNTFGSDDEYKYTIRVNSTNFNNPEESARPVSATTPPTNVIFRNFKKNDFDCVTIDGGGQPITGPIDESCTARYIYNGALTIQRLVQDYILWEATDGDMSYSVAEGGVGYISFPTLPYTDAGFFGEIALYVPLFMVLVFLYGVSNSVRLLVTEKEQRQVELLKIMSVTQFRLEFTWILSFLLFGFPSYFIAGIVSTGFWEIADAGTLVFFWIIMCIMNILFCTSIAAFFSKATRAVFMAILFYFIGYIIVFAVDLEEDDIGIIGLVCLHPVSALSIGFTVISDYEDKQVNILDDANYPNGLVFDDVIGFMIRDIFLLSLITWYFNRVVKGEYGRANPLNFPFLKSYWFPSKETVQIEDANIDENDGTVMQPDPEVLKAQVTENKCVSIRNLRMCFKNVDGSEKVAVSGLNLNMYSGQVTALLGHNGAGKTTTISMLTGILKPSSGDASIMGKSINTDMSEIRQNIGICLQHDCLFDLLNVQEHIELYSMLKGSYNKESVTQTMKDVALLEKRYTMSKNLSGGMKRKLSVAIAFCGDSKTVFLDEPTSGMDPYSRRFTWNLIRQYRQDRCIVLTTHFMDEADLLGDRIAILGGGKLKCVGSSLFLKKEYGVGYQLVLEKSSSGEPSERAKKEMELVDLVNDHVSESSILSNVGTEISFQLPLTSAPKFPTMLRKIEEMMEGKNSFVRNYGVSITTLEEVFLIIARGDDDRRLALRASSKMDGDAVTNVSEGVEVEVSAASTSMDSNARKLGGIEYSPTFSKHVTSLIKKRVLNFKRDKKAWVCSVLLPVVIAFMGLAIIAFVPLSRNLDSLVLRYEDLNEGIDSNQNPLVFNTPGLFSCNPGRCINTEVWNDTKHVDDVYKVCGAYSESSVCSVDNSETFASFSLFADPAVGIDATDVLQTSSALNMTKNDFGASRYGAVFFTRELDSEFDGTDDRIYSPKDECGSSGEFTYLRDESLQCPYLDGLGYVVAYNFTALHSSVLYTAIADENILRSSDGGNGNQKIEVTLHPLPVTAFEEGYAEGEDAFTTWFMLLFSFPIISGGFASFIVSERRNKAKHLQTVAGVKPSAYWLSTYLWDIMNYQLALWPIFLLMLALGVDVYTTTEDDIVSATLVCLILFGPAAAGFTYCVSFAFKDPSTCQFFLIIFNIIVGSIGPIISFVLRILDTAEEDDDTYLVAARLMEWILRFNPSFCLGHGLFFIINIPFLELTMSDSNISAWSSEVVLNDVIVMLVQSFAYPALACFLDISSTNPSAVKIWDTILDVLSGKALFNKCKKSSTPEAQIYVSDESTDEDILAEEKRVLSEENKCEDAIVIKNLVKQWNPQKIAVNNMSFGIPAGEVFGLLGINGAGKTTTMGMLTAEFPPTSGDAWLNGYSVTNEPEMIRRSIGYCPQFDAHFMNMTGREHVELYANIKGVPKEEIHDLCAMQLKAVGLSDEDADKLSSGYSGGMKRKLSVACASIGRPRIVFLDEPSTGMDPVARRDLWKTIIGMTSDGSTSVILTTHSMEECEALCPRIGIMATGRLKCLGSAQHLKSRYGTGYQAELTVLSSSTEDDDYIANSEVILSKSGGTNDEEADNSKTKTDEVFVNLEIAQVALLEIAGDTSLVDMLNETDPNGYVVYKEANSSAGISVSSLAQFCTDELRVRKLISFINGSYDGAILRERQESKCRFEIPSNDGLKISSIFELLEENKDSLRLSDYGASQTSLEQVFNIHAAEAEKEKQGRIDN